MIECEKQSALHGIAGINQEHIRLHSSHTVNHYLATRYASQIFALYGVDLRVGVVGMQNDEFIGIRRGRNGC
jgi:hypothetical protein